MVLIGASRRRLMQPGWRSLSLELGKKCFQRESSLKTSAIIERSQSRWCKKWSPELQKKIEKHWQIRLQEKGFDPDSEKEKMYVLSMFPYPSGNLHMGHIRVYTTGDILARYHRLMGRNVLFPMGWDAFGLPAENAAIERKLDPDVWTQGNIETMKSVMEKMNFSFDWNREFATCDSDYYKWTQYLFLKLYENDLVYRKEGFVNWDPVDKTVLADEQVDAEGRSWRSGALVERKLMTQWFVRTTRYSRSLYDGLDDPALQDWKEIVKMQRNWIGKCDGFAFEFRVVDNASRLEHETVSVWMPKPEHMHKVKYVAVSPESTWNSGLVVSGPLPYKLMNPLTGEVVPVFATNFFRYPAATESRVGVPEHSEDDRMYAESVNLSYVAGDEIRATEEELAEFRREVCEEAQRMGIGGYPASSRARDWLISRQRRWGTPIPITYCDKCGPQPVPDEELPVKVTAGGEEAEAKCGKCGGPATRETDTMDTFVDSSWYFLRFLDPDNVGAPFNVEKAKRLMPVDVYIGGIEHAILHLYYARFLCHFLHSAGLLPHKEPFKRILSQGIVRGKTYYLERTKEYVHPSRVTVIDDAPVRKDTGERLSVAWEKMSKSKHNGVNPNSVLEKFGSDATRLVISDGYSPWDARDWNEDAFNGIIKWQTRLWNLVTRFIDARNACCASAPDESSLKAEEDRLFDSRNYVLHMVNYSLEKTLNTSIAINKMQSLTKDLMRTSDDAVAFGFQFERALAVQIILLAPFAPCFASELWRGFASAPNRLATAAAEIDWDKPVLEQSWPKVDDNYETKLGKKAGTIKRRYDEERQRRKKKKKEEEEELGEKKLMESANDLQPEVAETVRK